MTQSIQVQMCAMVLMLLVCYFSFIRHSVVLKSMLLYRQLVVVTTGCVAADILSIIGIAHANSPLTDILCKIYLFFVIWTSFLSFNYVCYDIVKIRRKVMLRRFFRFFTLVSSIIPFFLPIDFYNSGDEIYSFGPAVTYTFVIAPIFIIASMVLILICKKHMNPYRSNAVMIWMLLETAGALIQINNRGLLLISFSMALGVTVLFAKLENPDSGIERVTGCYRISLLREYIQQLYDNDDKERALIVIENEELEKELSIEAIMLIEIANFLKRLNCGKVFRGIGNDFVIVFNDVNEAKKIFPAIKERFEFGWHEGNILHPHYLLVPTITVFENPGELFSTYRYYSNMTADSSESFLIIDSEALDKMKEFRFMQSEIKAALNENRFIVFLQPIYSVKERKFVSAEALVRMKNREGNLIMPSSFIPIAEQTGQIEQIGERVFEIVCDVIKEHDIQELGLNYIEINLSVIQCENRNLAARFSDIIRRYEIEPNTINLEITESGSIKQKSILLDNMDYLSRYGCTFSLDDFGTGESNLNYIVNMPVDIVKFDRSMILSYFSTEKAGIMLEYVTGMIKRMGMKIVAEGVEEKYQFEALSKLGIDYIQGYYFSKPIPIPEFISFVRRANTRK